MSLYALVAQNEVNGIYCSGTVKNAKIYSLPTIGGIMGMISSSVSKPAQKVKHGN